MLTTRTRTEISEASAWLEKVLMARNAPNCPPMKCLNYTDFLSYWINIMHIYRINIYSILSRVD